MFKKYPLGLERKKSENRSSKGGLFRGFKPKGSAIEGLLSNSKNGYKKIKEHCIR